jgi:probable O-glycosylation ligase (exosortase A-associated)
MFAVILVAFILASLPICFLWPWIGSGLWWWVSFMNPYELATGFGYKGWFGSLISVATVAGAVMTTQRYRLPRSPQLYLLLALWAWCGFTTAVAAINPRAWARLLILSQILATSIVVVALFQERRKLTALLWVTALSLGSYATTGALWMLRTPEAERLDGPWHSQLQNNNDLAAALVALAPFFVFLGHGSPRRWLRYAALVVFGAMVVAILGTYSRASFLAFCVLLVALGWWRQWRAVAVACAAWIVFLSFTSPAKWLARIASIGVYWTDASAVARFDTWYVALRVGLDHPILGAGFRPFSEAMYQRYIPGYHGYRDAHNMFLQVFAEHGFPGLMIYTALVVSTLLTLWRTARHPVTPATGWIHDYARMLLLGLACYLVAGTFHCLSYREIFFHLLVLGIIVDTLARAPGHAVEKVHRSAREPWRSDEW